MQSLHNYMYGMSIKYYKYCKSYIYQLILLPKNRDYCKMVVKKGIIMTLCPAYMEMILTNEATTNIDNYYNKLKSACVKYLLQS